MITVKNQLGQFVISDDRQVLGHTSERVYAFRLAKGHAVKRGISRLTWMGKPIAFGQPNLGAAPR